MVPGAEDPAAKAVRATSLFWGTGTVSVVGERMGQSAPLAALANGTAAHALDFDDNFDPAKTHASAVLVPALLALAQEREKTADDVIDAYIVGLQILCRVGQAVNPHHRNRGWHATATLGAIGATAACARLLRLPPDLFAHALNLSTSFAGGFMSQFGSMTKPLHAGLAAKGGVMAASFAEGGITAGEDTFAGATGLARLMVGADIDTLRADNPDGFEHGQTLRFDPDPANVGAPLAILEYGLKVKRWPACGSTHRALDALVALRVAHGLVPGTVARIDVHAPASHLNNLMHTNPQTPAEGKFSLEYCLAAALAAAEPGAGVGMADFTEDALHRPAVRALMGLVHRHPVDALESAFPTRVTVQTTDGSELTETVDAPLGRADNPLSDAQLHEKGRACLQLVLNEAATTATLAALDQFHATLMADSLFAALRTNHKEAQKVQRA